MHLLQNHHLLQRQQQVRVAEQHTVVAAHIVAAVAAHIVAAVAVVAQYIEGVVAAAQFRKIYPVFVLIQSAARHSFHALQSLMHSPHGGVL